MAARWEVLNGDLYWVDPDDVYVPVEAMEDLDWEEAVGVRPVSCCRHHPPCLNAALCLSAR